MFNKHLPLLHGNVSILPEVRFFLPADAGNAVFLHDKRGRKTSTGVSRPQIKIIFPLMTPSNDDDRRQRAKTSPAPGEDVTAGDKRGSTGRSCWGSGQQDASAAQGTRRMLGAATRKQRRAFRISLCHSAVRAVRTRYSMACTGYCPAAVSPVSITLAAPSSTAL